MVSVTHKGTLVGGSQDYALVWRGLRASAPVAVGPGTTPSFRLDAPVPHPIRTRATIGYQLDREASVSIRVYDVRGRRVATLIERGARAAGSGSVEMDATGLASGVYFLKMETPARTVTRKITIVK